MLTLNKIIEPYLEDLGERLKKQLRDDKHYATGKTEKSIHVVSKPDSISLVGNVAPKYLTEGGKPHSKGTPQSIYSLILEWVKAKKVTPPNLTDEQFARAISAKRYKYGYTVPNQFNDGQSVKKIIDTAKITKELNEYLNKEIVYQVVKEITSNIKLII